MTFEKWIDKQQWANVDEFNTQDLINMKLTWDCAQHEQQAQIDALKTLLIEEAQPEIKNLGEEVGIWQEKDKVMQDLYTKATNEIWLLRAVYIDARAVMLLNKDRIAPSVANSLGCAIGCVERFDEGESE